METGDIEGIANPKFDEGLLVLWKVEPRSSYLVESVIRVLLEMSVVDEIEDCSGNMLMKSLSAELAELSGVEKCGPGLFRSEHPTRRRPAGKMVLLLCLDAKRFRLEESNRLILVMHNGTDRQNKS